MSARNWMFTINNPTSNDEPKKWAGRGVKYVVWQLEKGEEGTPHLQGYLELDKHSRLSAMKKLSLKAHWEKRMGTQEQAIDYCMKEDTRVEGPWEQGEKKQQGQRSDLEAACATAKDKGITAAMEEHPTAYAKYHKGLTLIAKNHRQKRMTEKQRVKMETVTLHPWQQTLYDKLEEAPDDRKIYWYWENKGNVGKTFFAKYLAATKLATVLDCSKKADLSYMLKEHEGGIVLFNIVRSIDDQYMQHVYTLCEQIKDDMVINTKYESCRVPLGDQHVVVFANQPPDRTKWSEDRYVVKEIDVTSPWNPPIVGDKHRDTVANTIKKTQSYTMDSMYA